MSLSRIRDFYEVPAYRGARVRYVAYDTPREGVITGSRGMYVRIRLDGETRAGNFHPTWKVEYPSETVNVQA
ncbi:MAG: hypothetical protein JWN63_3418 [Candidatus Acidoferrum typicum]|nr:hypothetical protein [Candidatus Acidoferrum typicum]